MKFLSLILCLALLCGCASESTPLPQAIETQPSQPKDQSAMAPLVPEATDTIGNLIAYMSLEERVGQLFLARCDEVLAQEHIRQYHLGGYLFFSEDFEGETPDSFRAKITDYKAAADVPMLFAVDEEGGTVTRISRHPAFRGSRFPAPGDAYAQGGLEGALTQEEEKCALLTSLGLNVNLGPVCDLTDDPEAFMYQRSLRQDAETTATYISAAVLLTQACGVGSVLKHFPGYGNNSDTHTGIAVDSRPLSQLEGKDLLPFAAGFDAGCGAILVSHTIVEALDPELPASLSPEVHRYLRQNMNFSGVIMTDDLMMEAVAAEYGIGEAAVLAVLAGNDLLISTDYPVQYDAVLRAVLDGRISIDILNAAVRNVLEWKTDLGLLG